jgi:hypothetical protein
MKADDSTLKSHRRKREVCIVDRSLYGHRLRILRSACVDQLECVTCGTKDWHRWTPFTGGAWVGRSPALDLYAVNHHRPQVLSQVLVVRDILLHVGAPDEDIAASEVLVALTPDRVTSTNLFGFLAGTSLLRASP